VSNVYKILRGTDEPDDPQGLFWFEVEQKQVVTILVGLNDMYYKLDFYTLERLEYTLKAEVERGIPCVLQAGLILVTDTSQATVHKSLKHLIETGFLNYLQPMNTLTLQYYPLEDWFEEGIIYA
jgi:hypothetical protein